MWVLEMGSGVSGELGFGPFPSAPAVGDERQTRVPFPSPAKEPEHCWLGGECDTCDLEQLLSVRLTGRQEIQALPSRPGFYPWSFSGM